MTRTIVDIPAAQLVEIDRLCKLMGISRAEAVRRALVAFAQGHVDVTPDAFGLWASRGGGGDLAPGAPGRSARPERSDERSDERPDERPERPERPDAGPQDDLRERSARG
ncbi:hypothetical protein CDL60_10590 [Roseateles noduli]|nr:hypothetical protein CDL60_10590 [Roseateles noduli]